MGHSVPGNGETPNHRSFRAMLDHPLESCDTLVATFGHDPPRRLVAEVERYLKRNGVPVDTRRRDMRFASGGRAHRSGVLSTLHRWLHTGRT